MRNEKKLSLCFGFMVLASLMGACDESSAPETSTTNDDINVGDTDAQNKEDFLRRAAGRYGHYDIVTYLADMGEMGLLENLIISYGFTSLDWEDGKLIATDRFCFSEHLSNQPFTSTVSDAFTQAIVPKSAQMEARRDNEGGLYLWRPRTPTLLGIEYEDSENTPLPKSIAPDDPRLVDHDLDGKPGVTAHIDMAGTPEEIYIARREIFEFEIRPAGKGVLQGVVHDSSEQVIIDATNPILKIQLEWLQDEDLSRSPILLVPVDDSYDCEKLKAERDALFPPNPTVGP